jgi:hypothetical protein
MGDCVHLLATVAFADTPGIRGSLAQRRNSSSSRGDLLHRADARGVSYAIASTRTADRQAAVWKPSSPAASPQYSGATITIESPGPSSADVRTSCPRSSRLMVLSAGGPPPALGLSKPSRASRLDLRSRLGAGASRARERVALHEPLLRSRQLAK